MNKNQKIAIAVTAAAVVGTVVQTHVYINQIMDRFPELDRKVARKAFRIMMTRALTGQYENIDISTDEQNDVIFLGIVREIDPWTNY